MNFELAHMKAHVEQKDNIMVLSKKKQTLPKFSVRCLKYTKDGFWSMVLDPQTMIILLLCVASFAFYLACLSWPEESEGTETPDTSIWNKSDF